MKNYRLFAIVACVAFLAATRFAGSPVWADESEAAAFSFKLTKGVYKGAKRTTFRLDVETKRKGLIAQATCDLRKDGMGVGRFPLERMESNEDPEAQSFRISCLHDDFVEDTIIHVLARDESTGKSVGGARILLKDAEPREDKKMSPAVSATSDVDEASATGNVQALSGKWKAVESSHHLLDERLVATGDTGFEIAVDKQLGESHRRTSETYYGQYTAFLEKNGHAAIASGTIKFDCGGQSEFVIAEKDGSLYLWYGVVTGGNPRIFLGRGSDDASVESIAIEWASWCSDSPVELNRDFATVAYERARLQSSRLGKRVGGGDGS